MSVFVIADPGADHLGSLSRMLRCFDAAKEAGADAIKPQLYRAESIYAEGIKATPYGDEDLRSIIRRYEWPLEWLHEMKEYADGIGIELMCSAFSAELYDAVNPHVRLHKIASLESGDTVLVDHVLSYGKPVIISTGASTAAQVREMRFRTADTRAMFLQCTTAYPAPITEANLAAIREEGLAGLSDHTRSLVSGAIAVAFGGWFIEKHITLGDDASRGQPDFPHSLDPRDFKTYVAYIREAEQLMGNGIKTFSAAEQPYAHLRRKPGKVRGEA